MSQRAPHVARARPQKVERRLHEIGPDVEGIVSPLRSEETPQAPRKGIQSIRVGFRILDFLVHAGRAVHLREIAAGTGLRSSNVHFYLVSLVAVGIVNQDRDSGKYSLGPYALKLGIAGLEQFDLFTASRDALTDLACEVGHSASLSVWANHGPTIVYRVDGPQSRSAFELRVGSVLPVLWSASGLSFLAHLAESITKPFVDRELTDIARMNLSQPTLDMPRNWIEVKGLIDLIRKTGISRCRFAVLSDYTAIAAPVFDHSGSMIAAVTLIGPIGLLDDTYDGPIASALRNVAARISSSAGMKSRDSI